jgi:hypothetical protein
MISLDTAERLKRVGYPQIATVGGGKWEFGSDGYVWCPYLHELIAACGDEFYDLSQGSHGWRARPRLGGPQWGTEPEEAVADLWIMIKKHGARTTTRVA